MILLLFLGFAAKKRLPFMAAQLFGSEFSNKKKNPTWALLFFTPYCKNYKPALKAFEEASELSSGAVKFGLVNCQADTTLCKQFRVESYPTIGFKNFTTFSEYGNVLNPVLIAKESLSFVRPRNVKDVDDFWMDDYREKPTAILFTDKPGIPGYISALSRTTKLRIGICRDESLASEFGASFPSLYFYNKTSSVKYTGKHRYSHVLEAANAFLEHRESSVSSATDFHSLSEFKEECYDYRKTCVISTFDFVDPKFEDVKNHYKSGSFSFFIGPYKNHKDGEIVIYSGKKSATIIVDDVTKLIPVLDRILDGSAASLWKSEEL